SSCRDRRVPSSLPLNNLRRARLRAVDTLRQSAGRLTNLDHCFGARAAQRQIRMSETSGELEKFACRYVKAAPARTTLAAFDPERSSCRLSKRSGMQQPLADTVHQLAI